MGNTWVKIKDKNDWINLDHVYRIEIRDDGLARFYFNNKEMIVAPAEITYLGKLYTLSKDNKGHGLLSQAPWCLSALSYAQKKAQDIEFDEEQKGVLHE